MKVVCRYRRNFYRRNWEAYGVHKFMLSCSTATFITVDNLCGPKVLFGRLSSQLGEIFIVYLKIIASDVALRERFSYLFQRNSATFSTSSSFPPLMTLKTGEIITKRALLTISHKFSQATSLHCLKIKPSLRHRASRIQSVFNLRVNNSL